MITQLGLQNITQDKNSLHSSLLSSEQEEHEQDLLNTETLISMNKPSPETGLNKAANNGSVQHVPCKFYKQGACTAGKNCVFSHTKQVEQEIQLCKYYQKGSCKFGTKCALSHGPEDDRKKMLLLQAKNKKKKNKNQNNILNNKQMLYSNNNQQQQQQYLELMEYYSSYEEYNSHQQNSPYFQNNMEYHINHDDFNSSAYNNDQTNISNSLPLSIAENYPNYSPVSENETTTKKTDPTIASNDLNKVKYESNNHPTASKSLLLSEPSNSKTNMEEFSNEENEHDFLPSSLDEIFTNEELENRRFKSSHNSNKYNSNSSPLVKNIWKFNSDIITENKSSKKPVLKNNSIGSSQSLFEQSSNNNPSYVSQNITSKEPQFNMDDLYNRLATLKYSNTYDLSPILSIQNSPNLTKSNNMNDLIKDTNSEMKNNANNPMSIFLDENDDDSTQFHLE